MARAAVQTYSFGEIATANFPEVLKRLRAMGFTAIETFETHGWPVAEIKALLDDLGMEVIGAHYDFPVGAQAAKTLEQVVELGSPYVMWSLEPEEFVTLDLIKKGVERINEAAENAARYGVRVGVHNHNAEFVNVFEGRYAYEHLKELVHPDVDFEFDMYWAAVAGADIVQVIKDLGTRVHHLHVKDGPALSRDTDVMVPLGEGRVDIQGAVKASPATYWNIVEFDRVDGDIFTAVEKSLNYLVSNKLAVR